MKRKKEKFLITGAAGFVGACLTRRLVARGEDVSAIIKPKTDLWRLRNVKGRMKVYSGDLADQSFVSKTILKVNPSVIYHLATHGAYSRQKNAEMIIKTNVLGTWNLINAASRIPYKVFVNTGSSSEYGFKSKAMEETDLLEPNSYYAVAKSAQSLLCQHVARSQNKPIVTFRLFSVFGYYEEMTRLVPTIIRRALKGQDLEMVSPKTSRDFIFVEDVVDAYLKIKRLSELSGEIINIGTGIQSTMKDMVKSVLQLTGSRVKVRWGAMPRRIWDTDVWICDTSKSKKVLGWQARCSLRDGLKKTVSWFKQEGMLY